VSKAGSEDLAFSLFLKAWAIAGDMHTMMWMGILRRKPLESECWEMVVAALSNDDDHKVRAVESVALWVRTLSVEQQERLVRDLTAVGRRVAAKREDRETLFAVVADWRSLARVEERNRHTMVEAEMAGTEGDARKVIPLFGDSAEERDLG
jgi:hypothetical protein